MATNSGKSKSGPKTMDVSHPGRSMPNATSRPTIVGHRAVLQDPMVVASKDGKESLPVASMTGRKLTPPSEEPKEPVADEKDEATAEPAEGEVTITDSIDDKPKKDQEPTEDTEEPKQPVEEEAKPEEDAPEPAKAPEQEDKEPSDAPATKLDEQKLVDKKLQEDQAKQEAIEKLVTDKTYYVPIGQKKHRRTKRSTVIWVILALLLAALLADLLIDSGMIKTSIKPPLSIFKTANP